MPRPALRRRTSPRRARRVAPLFEITNARPAAAAAIETLLDQAFGPARLAKSSYSYRRRVSRLWPLCLVAREADGIVGTIRYWPIAIGAAPALLLGPVAVRDDHRATGVGGLLMRASLARAAAAGHQLVVLVGDEAYYGRFGFKPAAQWGISMERENPARVLALPLGAPEAAGAPIPSGVVQRWRSVRREPATILAA
jgi:predicted N-acetyltransferase YhbS